MTGADTRRLAGLLVTDVKLYNEKHVAALRQDLDSRQRVLAELGRAYEIYTRRVGDGQGAQGAFRDEAVRILADGDAGILETGLSGLFRRRAGQGG
jgi:hypothetical protein